MATDIICFDLDGTLIDSTDVHVKAFQEAAIKNNLRYRSSFEIARLLGPPAEVIAKRLYPRASTRKLQKLVKDKIDITIKKTAKYVMPIKGVLAVLKDLKKKYKLVLITNCTHKEMTALLKKAGIDPKVFDLILTKETLPAPKPSKKIIEYIENKLKGKVKYFVGDTTYDVNTAKAAKVKSIAVLSGVHDYKTLQRVEPDIILKDISYLPKITEGEW